MVMYLLCNHGNKEAKKKTRLNYGSSFCWIDDPIPIIKQNDANAVILLSCWLQLDFINSLDSK